MDLQMLAERTGLPLRKLRYVLDHNVVPGLDIEIESEKQGRPRKFSDDLGIGIACAAFLLEAGIQRSTVTDFLSALMKIRIGRKPALQEAINNPLEAVAMCGDARYVRLQLYDFDSSWIEIGTWTKPKPQPNPKTVIQLDFGVIRDIVVQS